LDAIANDDDDRSAKAKWRERARKIMTGLLYLLGSMLAITFLVFSIYIGEIHLKERKATKKAKQAAMTYPYLIIFSDFSDEILCVHA
jgi:hypothetical protein